MNNAKCASPEEPTACLSNSGGPIRWRHAQAAVQGRRRSSSGVIGLIVPLSGAAGTVASGLRCKLLRVVGFVFCNCDKRELRVSRVRPDVATVLLAYMCSISITEVDPDVLLGCSDSDGL